MWVVRVALQRPYLFVVLALLIAIFGVLAALNTPTVIFPSLNIPVVSVADIGLMLALGGGWTVPPEPPAKPGLASYLAE